MKTRLLCVAFAMAMCWACGGDDVITSTPSLQRKDAGDLAAPDAGCKQPILDAGITDVPVCQAPEGVCSHYCLFIYQTGMCSSEEQLQQEYSKCLTACNRCDDITCGDSAFGQDQCTYVGCPKWDPCANKPS